MSAMVTLLGLFALKQVCDRDLSFNLPFFLIFIIGIYDMISFQPVICAEGKINLFVYSVVLALTFMDLSRQPSKP